MKVLLDTHALIWALEASSRLSKHARATLEDPNNEICVSAVSAWEIAIKKALGRLHAPDDLPEAVRELGFVCLDLGFSTAQIVQRLPQHHQDPFDRMLVAQAIEAGIPIMSLDPKIAQYQVQIVW